MRAIAIPWTIHIRKEELKVLVRDKMKEYMKDFISLRKFNTLHRKFQLLKTQYERLNKQNLKTLTKIDGYADKNKELRNKIKELKEETKLLKKGANNGISG